MSLKLYVAELENLILTKYLPVYKDYCADKNIAPDIDKISKSIVSNKDTKEIPALLKPRKDK